MQIGEGRVGNNRIDHWLVGKCEQGDRSAHRDAPDADGCIAAILEKIDGGDVNFIVGS